MAHDVAHRLHAVAIALERTWLVEKISESRYAAHVVLVSPV
jgi:hypothetical protein